MRNCLRIMADERFSEVRLCGTRIRHQILRADVILAATEGCFAKHETRNSNTIRLKALRRASEENNPPTRPCLHCFALGRRRRFPAEGCFPGITFFEKFPAAVSGL